MNMKKKTVKMNIKITERKTIKFKKNIINAFDVIKGSW